MRMMSILIGLGLFLIPSFAQANAAGEVNAEEFYVTAVELEKKGMRALFDKRTKVMQAQMEAAGASARSANAAATKRGAPLYCVPEAARKKGLSVKQVLSMLADLGQTTRRKLTLESAWLQVLRRSYPCGD